MGLKTAGVVTSTVPGLGTPVAQMDKVKNIGGGGCSPVSYVWTLEPQLAGGLGPTVCTMLTMLHPDDSLAILYAFLLPFHTHPL